MGHNWPPAGGVDPLLTVENPPTSTMRREYPASRSFRFYQDSLVSKVAFEDPDAAVLDPIHELLFTDEGRTDENFESSRIIIVNDGPGEVEFSFDGVTVHGELLNGEAITMDERRERRIFYRRSGGSNGTIRTFVW